MFLIKRTKVKKFLDYQMFRQGTVVSTLIINYICGKNIGIVFHLRINSDTEAAAGYISNVTASSDHIKSFFGMKSIGHITYA